MNMREYVEYLLKNYLEIRNDIEQLKFELKAFTGIAPEEMIDALNYTAPEGDRINPGRISDKTGHIALIFRMASERMNRISREEIERMIVVNEYELMRLEYCIGRLDSKVSSIVQDMYFQSMSWADLCKKHFISEKTINKYRKKAIEQIAEMFEIVRPVT